MTAQSCDVLIVRGKKLDLLARPLEDSHKWSKRAARLPISVISSANWNGYTCIWEIRDSQLWLVGMEGTIMENDQHLPLSLDHLVPPDQQPLLADWVTEILYAGEGIVVVHGGAGFMYKSERERIFEIEKGEVMAEVLRINPPPPIAYKILPDGTRKLLERDPYTYHGFKDLDFHGYRYLLEPGTPWGLHAGYYTPVDDLFAPDEDPTGGPFWAMQAELYRRLHVRDCLEAEEWERMKLEKALREARSG